MSGKSKKNENEECGCYAKSRTEKTCPAVRNVTHPLRYYEFSQEEIKALEDCDKESFYRRCLPFSALFSAMTLSAIRFGYLKINRHFGAFGAVPNVVTAAVLGHFCGRIVYQPQCDKKLRRLEKDSHLGNTMRNYYKEKHTQSVQK